MVPTHFNGDTLPCKTLDIGFRGTSLSTDISGTILQLGTFHPKHGIMLAEPYSQFDGTRFYDNPYVREYRTRMLTSIKNRTPGFGLRLHVDARNIRVELDGLGCARVEYETSDGLSIQTRLQVCDGGEITQIQEISSSANSPVFVQYTLDLGISLNRASYGQLTEGGPIPLPKSENTVSLIEGGNGVLIVNSYLGAHFEGRMENNGKLIDLSEDIKCSTVQDSPVVASSSKVLELPPGGHRILTAKFCLRPGTIRQVPSPLVTISGAGVPKLWNNPESIGRYIVRRNLEYILGNCTIPLISLNNAVCLITDHVALPLGWMRDNYWQVRFLLDVFLAIHDITDDNIAEPYSLLIKNTVKGHLTWVFKYAQRPHRFWHRSYLTTGRTKDGPVFQLDQQCYPLLEVCDFFHAFPEERDFVEGILNETAIPDIIDMIQKKKDSTVNLFPTDETPGDDAVEYPFHFSSHVLLWYTISRLSKLVAKFKTNTQLSSKGLMELANQIRNHTLKHFLVFDNKDNKPSFAYLVNGSGLRTFYHDANDIPTLFAPSWEFMQSDLEKEAWRNTMEFAFSSANDGGFYGDGYFGGLGSVHTRGPWPLGYFQQWKFSQMTSDREGENVAWEKICGAMLWDGLFSEAVDGQTGQCTSKAWFSWPGSMIGSGLLQSEARQRYL